MLNPWDDLALFDWVLASGSTLSASRILRIPQSTVSRRFRSFCSEHRLSVRRRQFGLVLLSEHAYVDGLRLQAQAFRCRHGLCCSAWQIGSEPFLQDFDQLPGRTLLLSESLWSRLDQFFAQGILDLAYVSDHVDALDGLPFKGPMERFSGAELDGLLVFRRRLHRELSSLTTTKPPAEARG